MLFVNHVIRKTPGILSAITAACLILIFACGKKENPASDNTNIIAGIPDTLSFGEAETTMVFTVQEEPARQFGWTAQTSQGWIRVSASQGSAGQNLTVTVNRSGLAPGEHYGALNLFLGSDADKKIVTVRANAVIDLVPGVLNLGVNRFRSLLTIHNRGTRALPWSASVTKSWLHCTPSSGTIPDSDGVMITVTVDSTSLAPGLFRDTITIRTSGGDTAVALEVVKADTGSGVYDYRLKEYWPIHTGNTWVWSQLNDDYWWAFQVADSMNRGGHDIWTIRAWDSDSVEATFLFTWDDGHLVVLSDTSDVANLPLATRYGTRNWSGDYSFPLFDASLKPGAAWDPFWLINTTYVPGRLFDMLAFYGIYQKTYDTAAFAGGDNNDCVGMLEVKEGRSHLYTVFAKDFGPVLWDYKALVYAKVNGQEYGAMPAPFNPGTYVNNDQSSPLLYWHISPAREFTYFMGSRDSGITRITHAVRRDDEGNIDFAIMFSRDYIPLLWLDSGLTASVHFVKPAPESAEVRDYRQAVLVLQADGGTSDVRVNLYPDSLTKLLDSTEEYMGLLFTDMRTFIQDKGVTDFVDLVERARQTGPDQPLYQVTAALVGMAASEVAFKQVSPAGPAKTAGPFLPFGIYEKLLGIGGSMMGSVAGDVYGQQLGLDPSARPGLPAVGMLKCQGLDISFGFVDVCHYGFFWPQPSMNCISSCMASLGCFTDICAPVMLSTDWVKKTEENNLYLRGNEIGLIKRF